MVRVNFNIRTTEGTKAVPVYMVLRWDGNRLVYATKQAVSPKNWDNKSQRVRRVLAEKNYAQINDSLDKLEQNAKRVFAEMDHSNNAITLDEYREVLDFETGRRKRPFSDFWSFVDYFISDAPKRIDPDTGLKLSPRTIAKYSGTRALLKQFSESTPGVQFSFDSMDDGFYNSLRSFMTNIKKYNQNTISKHFTVLRTILREADEKGVRVNKAYTGRSASAKPQEAFAIYLNKKDIAKLEELEASGTMQRVKDNLLTGCYTGLRFSDWKQLNSALFTERGIELFQEKTGGRVVIPMNNGIKSILQRNGGKFPLFYLIRNLIST
ncbi:site-specific integrase [Niabella sp. W65]|nr:site-specific integrase [Niabella sp. W65]MCH7368613.1 site-specific integrase [Niabella sp. W65]ULT44203.1 site-specific integrase [Niabella sp. I65]